MKVLVLGGTGVISRGIVAELLHKGHDVVLYNRGNHGGEFVGQVETLVGDRNDRQRFEDAMRKQHFDAVIDMICFNVEDAASTIRAFKDNTGHIIVTSSVAVYKRPFRSIPTSEAAEELWDNPEFAYAYHKAQVERCLQKAAAEDGLPVTIIRPSLTFGPGAANIGVLRQNYGILDRIRKGKPLVMFGDGTIPWSFTFAPDLACAYVSILGNSGTFGQAYHVASEELHVWEDLYLEFGKILGIEPNLVHIPSALLRKAAPNLCSHLYFEKSYSGLFDNSKFRTVKPDFKAEITLNQGLRIMVEWLDTQANKVDPEKDALEDRLVELYQNWSVQLADLYTK